MLVASIISLTTLGTALGLLPGVAIRSHAEMRRMPCLVFLRVSAPPRATDSLRGF